MEVKRAMFPFILLFCYLFLFLAQASSMGSAAANLTATGEKGGEHGVATASTAPTVVDSAESSSSFRRALGYYNPRAAMTCDRYPRICYVRGSPGRDCCRKRCVDLKWDYLNCGRCGRRCRYGEACCHGRCVNVMFDPRNCGRCYRTCKRRSRCRYGMCGYGH